MNTKALEAFQREYDSIATVWQLGMMGVIIEKNPEMYKRMERLDDEINVLIAKDKMDKVEGKRFAALLEAWKRIHELGFHYASRHIKN